jgi:hypothetical protein
MVLCNTAPGMIYRCADIIEPVIGRRPRIRKVWKGERATRYQYWIELVKKSDLQAFTEAILPHLTAKRVEGEVAAWYLRRSCQARMYKQTALDIAVLKSLSVVKRNGGEAPAEVLDLLREVIPSEALEGYRPGRSVGSGERVETSDLSPNNNDRHERPAPKLQSIR